MDVDEASDGEVPTTQVTLNFSDYEDNDGDDNNGDGDGDGDGGNEEGVDEGQELVVTIVTP